MHLLEIYFKIHFQFHYRNLKKSGSSKEENKSDAYPQHAETSVDTLQDVILGLGFHGLGYLHLERLT